MNSIRRNKQQFPIKYVLFSLTTLCLILIILSFVFEGFASPVKSTVSYALIPVQKGMNNVGGWFTNRADDMKNLTKLKSENRDLKEQIADLQNKNALSAQEKSDLKQLREYYNLKEYDSYETTAARVISSNSSNWFSTFTIDKGKKDGIEVDMNVIGSGGLIGIVCDVGDNYAIVRSLIDDESNVYAQFALTSDKCVVKGSLKLINEGLLKVFNIDKDADIKDGDMLVTSNVSSKFLPGIVIGYVRDIENDSNNLTKSAYVTPAVDFAHLDIVLVIKQLKYTGG